MTLQSDIGRGYGRLVARPGAPLPVDKLVIGKPVAEVAALLPRLFNLCRAAQEVATAQALGLPRSDADVTAEIRRDHILKLFVTLPGRFGGTASVSPALLNDTETALAALFGAQGKTPETPEDMMTFLASGQGIAPLLSRIAGCFGPGEADASGLPLVTQETAFQGVPVENSPAARRAAHPGLRAVETLHGRGPLWRCLGRAVDLGLILQGDHPEPQTAHTTGAAFVPATRGLYAVTAATENGCVTQFARVTPTDHMTTPGGMLDLSLATLPADRSGLGPLLLDILDPCSPVRLEEVAHA